MEIKMGINEIVYYCKDNLKLLDELVATNSITELDYEKAKMIIADTELCALACEKYLQGVEGLKDESPSFPQNQELKKDNKKLKIGITGVVMVAAIFAIFRMVTVQTIDLSGNVIVKMSQEAYSKDAKSSDINYFSNIEYYRTDGDYDDMFTEFEIKGLSKEEADSLVPKYDETTSKYLKGLNIVPIASKESEITNGDEIKIEFEYDKGYVRKNNLKVIGDRQTFKVEGLKEHVDENNYQTADMSMLKDICDNSLSQKDLKNSLAPSDQVHTDDLTPCYVAKEKDVDGEDLMIYRSISSSKTMQGQIVESTIDLGIPLSGYIKDNKYQVEYQGATNSELVGLYDADSGIEGYELPTEDKYYIAEVK